MILSIFQTKYIEISEELSVLIKNYYTDDRLRGGRICCQDIQELTVEGTKLSDEANALRDKYGQFIVTSFVDEA